MLAVHLEQREALLHLLVGPRQILSAFSHKVLCLGLAAKVILRLWPLQVYYAVFILLEVVVNLRGVLEDWERRLVHVEETTLGVGHRGLMIDRRELSPLLKGLHCRSRSAQVELQGGWMSRRLLLFNVRTLALS